MTFTKIQLTNGLQLICRQLPHRCTVNINVRVDAGSRCELPHEAGLAHFVEHLLFQGTQQYPSNYSLTSSIEQLGGEIWGATHAEYTSYWLNIPRKHLTKALPIFLGMFRHAVLDTEAIERERAVLADELAESAAHGAHRVQLLLDQALWGDHPLAYGSYESQDSIKAILPDRIRQFVRQRYVPATIVASVVGDITTEVVHDLFTEAWGDWAATDTPYELAPPSHRSVDRFLCQTNDDTIVHLLFGMTTPPMHHQRIGEYQVLSTLVGGGMSSRLYTVLRNDYGLCYSLENHIDELRHACVLTLYIVTQPAHVAETIREVCRIFHELQCGAITLDELEQARGQTIGQLLMAADRGSFHAKVLSLSTFLTRTPICIEEQIAQIEEVSLASLKDTAAHLFEPARLHLACVGPVDDLTWQQALHLLSAS